MLTSKPTLAGYNNPAGYSYSKGPNFPVDKAKLEDTFLKLLMANMKHRDPLEPSDNMDFTSQLASFAMMEQLSGINSKLDNLAKSNKPADSENFIGDFIVFAPYLGNNVGAKSDNVYINDGSGNAFYTLGKNAAKVKIEILQDNDVVYTKDLSKKKAGLNGFALNNVGLQDGKYDFKVSAFDASGNPISVDYNIEGKVDSINFGANSPTFVVNGIDVNAKNIVALKKA